MAIPNISNESLPPRIIIVFLAAAFAPDSSCIIRKRAVPDIPQNIVKISQLAEITTPKEDAIVKKK